MAIRIEHGRPETIIAAAKRAGEAQAAAEVARRAQAESDRLEALKMEMEYKKALRQQDMVIDLQMQERAKLWQIEKMEMASRMDFAREEQARQRKLDGLDSAIQQLDKEVQGGRITEEEAYPYKLKLELAKSGVNVPIEDIRGGEDRRFGVDPYWMRGQYAPEGTPERALYESKMAEGISGERMGTRPYYFDPSFLSTYPEAARQAQEARGIFLSDEEFNAMARGETAGLPLADKSLDIGVQTGVERPLDAATARAILTEAGGDRELARQIARQRGYTF